MIDKPKHCLNWRQCISQAYQLESNIHSFVHTLCINAQPNTNAHTFFLQALPFLCCSSFAFCLCLLLYFCPPVPHISFLLWLTEIPYATNQKSPSQCIIGLRHHTNNIASVTRGEQLVQLPVQMLPLPSPLLLCREVSCVPFPLCYLIMQFSFCL